MITGPSFADKSARFKHRLAGFKPGYKFIRMLFHPGERTVFQDLAVIGGGQLPAQEIKNPVACSMSIVERGQCAINRGDARPVRAHDHA